MANFWKDQTVLVTGAGGFIGSWLSYRLCQLGANVVGLLRDMRGDSNFFLLRLQERTNVVLGDVRDGYLLERVLSGYEVRVCFHLAAQAIVGAARASPVSTFESNVRGTWSLLDACRHVGSVQSVIVASSDKAYGDHSQLPYTEEFALQPKFPYETSKACMDMLARCYAHTFSLPVAITRCSNVYGGGDLNFARLIPGTIKAVLKEQNPVIRSDGTPLRDYLYIDDAVSAYLVLAEELANRAELVGESFNFGSGQPVSVLQLTQHIIDLAGKFHLQPHVQGKGKPLQEIAHQYVSIEKARRLLRWQPNTMLEEGLTRTIEWYAEFFRQK